ncbi:MAG: hypothetical protein AAFX06_06500 [Planctomycetota bacterium]
MLESADRARERYLAMHPPPEMGEQIAPGLTPDTQFFHLPEQLLRAYEKHREGSLLGSVFEIANGMHDVLDAIVVFGTPDTILGVKALHEACCDPHHNEQDRATRGSKPRIYFAHDAMDNDATQSLMWRLERGGYGDLKAERDWMLIALDAATRHSAVVEQLLRAKPIDGVAVWHDGQFSNPILRGLEDRVFDTTHTKRGCSPHRIDRYWPLTPFGLLPAAFLGLDVVQLLVGAYEVTENFKTAPPEDNLVLRLASIVSLGVKQERQPAWCVWTEALRAMGDWMETCPWTRVLRSHAEADSKRNASFYQLLEVQEPRTDVLPGIEAHRDQLVEDLSESWKRKQILSTRLTLPRIDTHSMGQLFQLLMLTSEMSDTLCS